MSLLLDALKEAEQVQRRPSGDSEPRQRTTPDPPERMEALSLAIEMPAAPKSVPAPQGQWAEQSASHEPDAAARPRRPSQASAAQGPDAPIRVPGERSRQLNLGIAILVTLAVCAATGYYFLGGVEKAVVAAPSRSLSEAAAAALTADSAPAPVPDSGLPPPVLAPYVPATRDDPEPGRATDPAAEQAQTARPQPLRVTRSAASPLQAAYRALQAGDLPSAREQYEQVLAIDAGQPDAHLGLGVIAQSQLDADRAVRHFRAVLTASPEQPRAWAGIAELAGDGELASMESTLRGLVARRPDASLNFALGNNLQRQRRWAEAQQQYFAAATAAPDNADYAFNLAVALDQLDKHAAAVEHYRTALRLATNKPVQFDTAAARDRLAVLESEEP